MRAVQVLRSQWQQSAERLERRLDGLADDEYFWEPAPGAWNVYLDPERGGWSYPYEFAPDPAPVTTIAWRLVHIAADNWIYWEHAFGPGERTFADLTVPSTAGAAIDSWTRSREPVTEWIEHATDGDLDEQRPSHLGGTRSAGAVLQILVDEQIHHAAEIALLRDLYCWTGTSR
ncbi:DinB family protein [Actinopolymorpha pittospori]